MQLKKETNPLEIEYFNYLFKGASTQTYIKILKTYQNDNGGFADAIEADLRLPHSPSKSTSRGFNFKYSPNVRIIPTTPGIKHSFSYFFESIHATILVL